MISFSRESHLLTSYKKFYPEKGGEELLIYIKGERTGKLILKFKKMFYFLKIEIRIFKKYSRKIKPHNLPTIYKSFHPQPSLPYATLTPHERHMQWENDKKKV
jgi:hypothetical protein